MMTTKEIKEMKALVIENMIKLDKSIDKMIQLKQQMRELRENRMRGCDQMFYMTLDRLLCVCAEIEAYR